MQRAKSNLLLIAIALLAGTAGFYAQRHLGGGSADAAVAGAQRVDFTLPDLDGRERRLSEWNGKVVVVNFWATWCPPCRKEIPDFVKLQTEYGARGVQFIGIAIDRPEDVRAFIEGTPVNYPLLLGDQRGEISQQYGNEMVALPYTVVIDRAGEVAAKRRGVFERKDLEPLLQSLL